MHQRVLRAAVSALFLVILSASSLAQGNGTQTYSLPLDNIGWYNPCCDEIMELSGTLHFSFKETPNDDGTVSIKYHHNLSGMKGLGLTSGIQYHVSDNGRVTGSYSTSDWSQDFSGRYRVNVVGKGKGGRACSFSMILVFHFALDESGNIVVDDFTIEFDCANGNTIQ